MSPFREALSDYLRVRRALGYKLKLHGKFLPQFVAYLEDIGAQTLTTEQALRCPVARLDLPDADRAARGHRHADR